VFADRPGPVEKCPRDRETGAVSAPATCGTAGVTFLAQKDRPRCRIVLRATATRFVSSCHAHAEKCGVAGYEVGSDYIKVRFGHQQQVYVYDHSVPGSRWVARTELHTKFLFTGEYTIPNTHLDFRVARESICR
jgi:hypothetical protein